MVYYFDKCTTTRCGCERHTYELCKLYKLQCAPFRGRHCRKGCFMWIFRLALTAIVLVLVLLIGIIEHVITWVVAKFDPKAALQMRSAYVRAGFTAVRFVAVGKTQIIGLENIPTDRAVLFIGNHRSMLDVVICGSVIPVPVGFISKIEREKIPLLHMQMKDTENDPEGNRACKGRTVHVYLP